MEELHDKIDSYTQQEAWNNFFDKNNGVYTLNDLPEPTLNYLLQVIENNDNIKHVLDNGCGLGRVMGFLNSRGIPCIGSDISENALNKAIKNFPNYPYFVHAESHNLPFVNNQFDLIWFWRVLHNMGKEERRKSLNENFRVLKRNGIFICSAQSDQDPVMELYRQGEVLDDSTFEVIKQTSEGPTIYKKHFYSMEELKNEIISVGFKIIDFDLISEYSGLKEYNKQEQFYWRVKALKVN